MLGSTKKDYLAREMFKGKGWVSPDLAEFEQVIKNLHGCSIPAISGVY